MDMCIRFAQTSEAKRLKVGSLIYKNGSVISMGINGTPEGWHTNSCEDESGKTLDVVLHAEMQALNKLRKSHESSEGSSIFISHSPCKLCCVQIAEAGIKEVFYREDFRESEGLDYLKNKGIGVYKI